MRPGDNVQCSALTSLHSTDGSVCHKNSTTCRLAPECRTGSTVRTLAVALSHLASPGLQASLLPGGLLIKMCQAQESWSNQTLPILICSMQGRAQDTVPGLNPCCQEPERGSLKQSASTTLPAGGCHNCFLVRTALRANRSLCRFFVFAILCLHQGEWKD